MFYQNERQAKQSVSLLTDDRHEKQMPLTN